MNPANGIVSSVAVSIFGILAQLGIVAYFYGKLTERVAGHEKDIDKLKETDGELWKTVAEMGRDMVPRITKVEAQLDNIHGRAR